MLLRAALARVKGDSALVGGWASVGSPLILLQLLHHFDAFARLLTGLSKR